MVFANQFVVGAARNSNPKRERGSARRLSRIQLLVDRELPTITKPHQEPIFDISEKLKRDKGAQPDGSSTLTGCASCLLDLWDKSPTCPDKSVTCPTKTNEPSRSTRQFFALLRRIRPPWSRSGPVFNPEGAKQHISPGQRPGLPSHWNLSPEGARQLGRRPFVAPFQGCASPNRTSQGVALG
jgi:hypothetical protein